MMDDSYLAEIEKRFANDFGIPEGLKTLSYSPWCLQLMRDAPALLDEVKRLRKLIEAR